MLREMVKFLLGCRTATVWIIQQQGKSASIPLTQRISRHRKFWYHVWIVVQRSLTEIATKCSDDLDLPIWETPRSRPMTGLLSTGITFQYCVKLLRNFRDGAVAYKVIGLQQVGYWMEGRRSETLLENDLEGQA